MTTDRVPSLAEADPELHKVVGESLCKFANTLNGHIGPVETSRSLFAIWVSFTSQYQAPEDTADYLAQIAAALRSGATYSRAN